MSPRSSLAWPWGPGRLIATVGRSPGGSSKGSWGDGRASVSSGLVATLSNNPEKAFDLLPSVDRLPNLMALDPRAARLEHRFTKQPPNQLQLALRMGDEPHFFTLLVDLGSFRESL